MAFSTLPLIKHTHPSVFKSLVGTKLEAVQITHSGSKYYPTHAASLSSSSNSFNNCTHPSIISLHACMSTSSCSIDLFLCENTSIGKTAETEHQGGRLVRQIPPPPPKKIKWRVPPQSITIKQGHWSHRSTHQIGLRTTDQPPHVSTCGRSNHTRV